MMPIEVFVGLFAADFQMSKYKDVDKIVRTSHLMKGKLTMITENTLIDKSKNK